MVMRCRGKILDESHRGSRRKATKEKVKKVKPAGTEGSEVEEEM